MIHLDQYTGAVVRETGWKDYPLMAKATRIGVRFHQGEFFGLPNFLMVLFTALGTFGLVISGLTLWWKRRPPGGLGVPVRMQGLKLPKGILAILILVGVFLPLFGASLMVIALIEGGLALRRRSLANYS
jgi:uncharacterized iron-regulated membrane protein